MFTGRYLNLAKGSVKFSGGAGVCEPLNVILETDEVSFASGRVSFCANFRVEFHLSLY